MIASASTTSTGTHTARRYRLASRRDTGCLNSARPSRSIANHGCPGCRIATTKTIINAQPAMRIGTVHAGRLTTVAPTTPRSNTAITTKRPPFDFSWVRMSSGYWLAAGSTYHLDKHSSEPRSACWPQLIPSTPAIHNSSCRILIYRSS
jgi:hypothetical protein